MSARDKFYTQGITQTRQYIKNTTVTLSDVQFIVSSSSTDTILHILPTSNLGIRFYTINNSEITPSARLDLLPNSTTQIIAKINTTGFNNLSTNLQFPVRFEISETPIPEDTSGTNSGPGFVCIPCFADESINRSGGCPPGQVCTQIQGQRCCVDENNPTGGREEVK